jgi:site-specific recombinase XerD
MYHFSRDAMSLPAIPHTIRHYVEHALSQNTRKAYATDLTHYHAWGGSIPANAEMVASYLTQHADTHSIATLRRRLVAISKAHTMQGHPDPAKHELVRLTMRGIRHVHGKPQAQVTPLLKDDLVVMLSHIPESVKGRRDRAMLLLGFCAALRRSELAAIRVEDISITAQGIILTLPRSKTDQRGEGRKIGIPRGRGRICPVQAVVDWMVHLGAAEGALFRQVNKAGEIVSEQFSDRSVANIIKHYARKAGLDAASYSGHSLRAGLATSAAQHGISTWKIRAQTGHKSDAMLARYIRDGDLFTGNAAALF